MKNLESLWQRGKEFLGVSYPLIAGAMTWISDHRFVSAVCNEGAFGCLADDCSARAPVGDGQGSLRSGIACSTVCDTSNRSLALRAPCASCQSAFWQLRRASCSHARPWPWISPYAGERGLPLPHPVSTIFVSSLDQPSLAEIRRPL